MAIVLRLSDSRAIPELTLFLRKQGCRAKSSEDGTVIVELPHALHVQQARMEVELYVRLWQALHGLRVDFLDLAAADCASPVRQERSGLTEITSALRASCSRRLCGGS
jgi:hypothetical protein